MIHHQHFFPVVNEQGRLQPTFLAVLNMEADKPELIARNLERVLTARLRDARFFWDADRERPARARLSSGSARVLFHKKLGSYAEKAERVATLAAWIASEVLGADEETAAHAATAGRLSKADLATDMVREMTELQGTMGGIYAREDGQPEAVWKAIYYHYLPVGVEADAPPIERAAGCGGRDVGGGVAGRQARHGGRDVRRRRTADRLARSVRPAARGARTGAHPDRSAGAHRPRPGDRSLDARSDAQRPTRAADAATRRRLSTTSCSSASATCWSSAASTCATSARSPPATCASLRPLQARRKLEVLPEFTESAEFKQLAVLFKRVRNIARNLLPEPSAAERMACLDEPAERDARARDRSAAAGDRRRRSRQDRAIAKRLPRRRASVRRWRSSSTTCW